jgi:arylsulfatase A-like enzyme
MHHFTIPDNIQFHILLLYTASEKYYNMYDPDAVPMERGLDWIRNKPEMYQILKQYREIQDKDMKLFRKINAIYLGMISYVDELVGRVVKALKEEGIYDDTIIIFCSDHGDYAGDTGQIEKWPSDMSDMITRVPLMIRRPGEKGGQRIQSPT